MGQGIGAEPGWRLPAYLWTEQLKTFSSVTRVIAVDPPSQGESTKTTEGNSPESRARDLHDLLATLGVARPVLVGWSQGAQDVAAYVQQFGSNSVAGVVFVDSPVSIGPAEIEEHREFSKIILSGIGVYVEHPDQYSRGMVESLFKQPHPDLDMKKLVESTLKTPTDTGIAMLVMDIFGADRSAALAKLEKPMLVIASAASPLLDLQKMMAGRIPHAQFVSIEFRSGASHADIERRRMVQGRGSTRLSSKPFQCLRIVASSSGRNFKAAWRPSSRSSASYTTPIPPPPILRRMR